MTKKQMLQEFLHDLNSRTCVEIYLIWRNGEKAGIGNPKAIGVALEALRKELYRQIEEA